MRSYHPAKILKIWIFSTVHSGKVQIYGLFAGWYERNLSLYLNYLFFNRLSGYRICKTFGSKNLEMNLHCCDQVPYTLLLGAWQLKKQNKIEFQCKIEQNSNDITLTHNSRSNRIQSQFKVIHWIVWAYFIFCILHISLF